MNKRGQVSFPMSDFSQGGEIAIPEKPNLLIRVFMGIIAVIFLIIFSPVLVSIAQAVDSTVCVNPITCLFFRFIVPAVIIGGIYRAVKYIWEGV